jgi:TusA-related sulfurtransferase
MNSERILDLREEVCPTTNLKTAQQLHRLPAGTILRVIVDNMSSLEGVMLTAKNAGHDILEVTPGEGSSFTITLKKKGEPSPNQ